jgi:hypothetical protein
VIATVDRPIVIGEMKMMGLDLAIEEIDEEATRSPL